MLRHTSLDHVTPVSLGKCAAFVLVFGAVVFGASSSASANDFRYREGGFQFGTGFGFTVYDPTAFSFGFKGDYYLTHNISLAPRLAVSLKDSFNGYFIMADAVYHIDLRSLRELVPYVGFGFGGTILKADGVDAQGAFTVEAPVGIDYYLLRRLSIGSTMYFMFPVHKFTDNFIFQWQVITARYIF